MDQKTFTPVLSPRGGASHSATSIKSVDTAPPRPVKKTVSLSSNSTEKAVNTPPRPERNEHFGRHTEHSTTSNPFSNMNTSREAMLEKKILELQLQQMDLIERLGTYEKYIQSIDGHDHNLTTSTGSGATASKNLLDKFRFKLEKSSKTHEAMESNEEMNAKFWTQKNNRKVKLDLERLEVLEPLTEAVGGSLARLYVVEVDGWICVMKELDIAFAREMSGNLIRTFESEVQFLESLPPHANIVRYLFHQFDMEQGKARLFMTRYSSSLRDEIVRRKAGIGDISSGARWCHCCPKCSIITSDKQTHPLHFTLAEATHIIFDIAKGLNFLHNNQILHRDLKSDNIFVKLGASHEIQRCLIGDFDSAKKYEQAQNRMSTAGTPGYIAPEIWQRSSKKEGSAYTYATDIYSFGILIFEILSFRRPFEELRGIAIQEQLMESANTYKELVSHLPKPKIKEYHFLIQLFHQCISNDPGERPTIKFIMVSLRNIINGSPQPKEKEKKEPVSNK